ncbi:MAG TPA: ABC transporter substrate-binding protein [Acidimicrobiales bacterium]|jgi:ABC-type branched-subunit amino acid transport system substrate-binding protein|nr:ABC transporter substrate-binding protein [Acidimicrobiales bacterium]
MISKFSFRKPGGRFRTPIVILAVLAMLASGCGARLTKAQEAALNNVSTGNGSANSGSSSDTSGSGGTGAGGTGSQVAGGSTGSAGSGSSSTGASSTGGTSAGSSGKTGASTSSGGKTGGSTGGTSGGSHQVTEASNPLAGPNGKVCTAGAPGSGPGVTASTVTVGNIATINGPVPGLFAGARYGAQAVSDYINSLGGLCGRQVKVDSADDQFDQATDQSEASQMSNSVFAFMGSFSLQDGGIPAGAPGVPDIGEALSSARFNAATNYSPQPEAPGYNSGEYQFIASLPQYKTATQHMAMLIENTPQTATTGAEEEAALKSVGYKFVFTDSDLQPTDPTFNGDVAKMQRAGVQGVVFQATATIIGQLANAMYGAGMKVVLGNYCPSAYDPAYVKNAGPGATGTLLSQSLTLYDGEDAATVPMVAQLDQWYARVNPGQVPDIYAVYAWMSGLMLAQSVNESGSLTRTSLTAGLKTLTNFTGDGLAAPANPVSKTPPSCYLLVSVASNNKFVRAPQDPKTGFICSPSGYYHYNG